MLQKKTAQYLHSILRNIIFVFHVMDGSDEFIAYIKTRTIEGRARIKTVHMIEEYLNENETQLLDLWDKAQKGLEIKKIIR